MKLKHWQNLGKIGKNDKLLYDDINLKEKHTHEFTCPFYFGQTRITKTSPVGQVIGHSIDGYGAKGKKDTSSNIEQLD